MNHSQQIQEHLIFLYGKTEGKKTWARLRKKLEIFSSPDLQANPNRPDPDNPLTERDLILITYGDQFQEQNSRPLESLKKFLEGHLDGTISAVHILPFFPYTSDDGFSILDYKAVNPALGNWEDIGRLSDLFQLMFDAVLNHISRESAWFQAFLAGEEPYTDYFISIDPQEDLSMVVRPRALPLLTRVETKIGERYVWTTFSDDQIDLNYGNPEVLLELIDTLLLYIEKGARFIRLDAIAYLWKEIGTPCIHLPETHRVVKLIRAVLDDFTPGTVIITETNVQHQENISYFGELDPATGQFDEAHMVYQFPLAPLTLHTFQTGDARALAAWAAGLETPGKLTTFFNFIASHDGIGVNPARGLLGETEVQALVERALAHGGQASYKTNSDGSRSVYELNITLYDALNDPRNPDPDLDIPRFIASQALMLSLAGVPGIYVHSLFGSRNCQTCFRETGRARSLNREKFNYRDLITRLSDPDSVSHKVFVEYRRLLEIRRAEPAFHPQAAQLVLPTPGSIFGLVRQPDDKGQTLLCLINVTPQPQTLTLELSSINLLLESIWKDIIHLDRLMSADGILEISLAPYQVRWLKQD